MGQRVAYYRRRRGYSQAVLSGLVGRSEEWLSQIERGARDIDRLSTILEVAKALRIVPQRLLPGPFHTTPRQTQQSGTIGTAPDVVPDIETAMLRYDGIAGLVGITDPGPVNLGHLERQVELSFVCSQTEQWSRMAPLVPGMIADSYHASRQAVTDAEKRRAKTLEALVYRVTSGMLDRLGEPRLPWVAAERSMAAAEMTEDPLLIAGGAWRLAVVLRHSGRLTESTDVPTAAADALRRDDRNATPEHLSVYGSLMLKGAVGAASVNDHSAVRDYLSEVERTAERLGSDRNDFWFAFGPTNVSIHRVWLALELGDPSQAIDLADAVPLDQLPPELAERRVSHLITVAWAYYLRRRYREALDALTEARMAAPEQLIFTGRVHTMLSGMLRRERRSIKHDLRELSEFVGVAG
ncbi:transcriptional regulator with XRE-family HTH domain/tetratricopeptide (TPR) repeat protein [Saccharopolyspora phatthalungensis]|uniref:Transcriptional regulator with XRE-family HTH domain/tetratricopeptide (TPR) repeat protein n=1 Tax=Saccharopolyspora phatthalungensis TaxID=664693 RepID=A0A840Q868_9PSEU|nr:transcriptional regulator with XRE-family HTH domain/tetratricopeptide (TPR) repeat protein [Saccharopolyspora phatthalungensis]MBB5158714.1 transcriptional regulator with XRE-family HTH domain/tetratricopeptide (TPR) repeat protein [Saccharopolyspora phatthalungensis]